MPSFFSKSTRTPYEPEISRPILVKPLSISDFEGGPRYQTPSYPPPPPPPPPPVKNRKPERPRVRIASTTPSEIVDLYDRRPQPQQITRPSKFQEQLVSPVSSVSSYSDASMPSPISPLLVRKAHILPANSNSNPHPQHTSKPFPEYKQPVSRPNTPSRPTTSSQIRPPPPAKTPPPPPSKPFPAHTQRTDALARGLSKHYAATFTAPKMASPVHTRTDTRQQGTWLAQGTTRVDPKEAKRQAEQEKKLRKAKEKADRKAEAEAKKAAARIERAKRTNGNH